MEKMITTERRNSILLIGEGDSLSDNFLKSFNNNDKHWKIDTKYYTAEATFVVQKDNNHFTETFHPEAVVYIYSAHKFHAFESVRTQSLKKLTNADSSCDIRIAICHFDNADGFDCEEHEIWFKNFGFETVFWKPGDVDPPPKNMFNESVGLERAKEILETNIWPGMVEKRDKRTGRPEIIMDEYEHEQYNQKLEAEISKNIKKAMPSFATPSLISDEKKFSCFGQEDEFNPEDQPDFNLKEIIEMHDLIFGQGLNADLLEPDDFESVIGKVQGIKEKSKQMNFKDRRKLAENVALAFSLAIGSDDVDDEIQNQYSSNETKVQIGKSNK